jgi:hypothetical protein
VLHQVAHELEEAILGRLQAATQWEGLKQEMDQVASVYDRFVGIPGNGRRISFRFLNVWLDGASIVQQMTAPEPAAGAV